MAQVSLKKLAKQMAPAYFKAAWSEVEDDLSLCVWVRKECGEELSLKQTGRLRTAIEALIATSTKVVIFVEGGVVQGCTSNDKHLLVIVVDRDNLADEEKKAKAEEAASEGTDDCVHDVFGFRDGGSESV